MNEDDYVSLMDDSTYELRKDLRLPAGKLGDDIREAVEAGKDSKVG